jgi:hypothetical protein
MKKPIFKSEEEQATFDKEGYVVVRRLIPMPIVEALNALYLKHEKESQADQHGMSNSSHVRSTEAVLKICQEIELLVTEYVDKHLINYKFFGGGFLVKKSGEDSYFDMHQDRTLVEEPQYCSLNFWMSLDDIGKDRGRLFVLKGSPRLSPYIRTAPEYSMKLNRVKKVAPHFFTYLDTEAGDVVFFNHALIHGSEKNLSGRSRMAAAMGIYSADAQLSIYYKDSKSPPNKAERYIIDNQVFINSRFGRPPEEAFDGYVSLNSEWVQAVTPQEFSDFMMQQLSLKEKMVVYVRKVKSIFQLKNG